MIRDPREGEWPEDGAICQHGQLRDNCGKCWDQARDDAESDWWADSAPSVEAVLRMTDEMLRRLQRREDEAMGAHLFARMGGK